ncbi:MAG: HTH-type transcriptional regulator NmtR [Bacteroidetes bacterium ADurb.Bin408]|nr:MAG: HTH-type transcriptional regulator NmtR [Bacteroidetes bacterium ADurb.Bin408]
MNKNFLDVKRLKEASSKLRVIAHPMRIAIIKLLLDNKKMNVTEIYTALGIEQASASHHLNLLKNKSILVSKRDGKNTIYSLKHNALSQIVECLSKCEEQ